MTMFSGVATLPFLILLPLSMGVRICFSTRKDPLNVLSKADTIEKGDINETGRAGPEVVKKISCSTQLSMIFKMLINIKISRNSAFCRLSKAYDATFPAHKY